MNDRILACFGAVVLFALCEPAQAADGQADTIFTSGRIHTLNPEQPEAEALAIRAGVITAVGDTDTITATAGPQTQRIDLGGKVVLPGFHDMHVHPLFAGVRQTECKIEQGSTLERIQHEVQACIDRTDTGGWISGGQWDAHAIGQIPDRSMLDTISPKNPVLLSDTSGHSAWANSRALNDDISKEVGDERTRRVWPVREMIEAGALVVPGSDWAVVPSVNPWIAVEALVTREEPGGSAKHFGKEQAVSLDQAIRLFTVNAAKHLGLADKVGRIEPGLLADLIVLDRDPYSIPVTELHQVRVEQTIINGTPVYQAN